MKIGLIIFLSLLTPFFLLACPPDDDDDNDDATPVDDDTTDDDSVDDDTLDDDTTDDDTTDDDSVDDDTLDDDTTDDDTTDDDTTDDDTGDDDTTDDDTVDDDTDDDDTTDDDTTDDDTADDDTTDDDTIDDDTGDDDTTPGVIWSDDFEDYTPQGHPGGNWVVITCGSVVETIDANGLPTQALEAGLSSSKGYCLGFATFNYLISPLNGLLLEADVRLADYRSSRLSYSLNTYKTSGKIDLRFTATAGEVVAWLYNRADPHHPWLRCGQFASDQWRTVAVAVDHTTPTFDVLLAGEPSACADIPLAIDLGGNLNTIEYSNVGDFNGSLQFDNFVVSRTAPGDLSEGKAPPIEVTDDDLECIDGDVEFYPNGRVSLAIDDNDRVHVGYQKRDHYYYHGCNYQNYYYAENTTDAWQTLAVEGGFCQIWIDTYLDLRFQNNAGDSSSLVAGAAEDPHLVYDYSYYSYNVGYHGYPDTETNESSLYYWIPSAEPQLIDHDYFSTSSYNGSVERSSVLVRDAAGAEHLAYILFPGKVYYLPPGSNDREQVNTCYDWYSYESRVSMTLDDEGEPHLIYYCLDNNYIGRTLHSSRQDGEWVHEPLTGMGYAFHPALTADAHGRLHLLSELGNYQSGTTQLFHSVYDGETWTSTIIDTATTYYFPATTLAVDGETGAVFVFYVLGEGLTYLTDRNGAWEKYVVSTPGPVTTDLALALDGDGRLHLAFGADYRLWHLAFAPDDLPSIFTPVEECQ